MSKIRMWLEQPLPDDARWLLERMEREAPVFAIAVMPDVHVATEVCVGTVIAAREHVYPGAVGGDIGCGMAAERYHGRADKVANEKVATRLLQALAERVPAVRHRTKCVMPDRLSALPLSDKLQNEARRTGAIQLGTLGGGNHFLELQGDDEGGLWIMVHSGSRAMGQVVRDAHLANATKSPNGFHVLTGEAARTYLADSTWALVYAEENRRAMIAAVRDVMWDVLRIEADSESRIECHHNYVREEVHEGVTCFVHRKGAISAREGEPGIVPGSMGTFSYHVTGRGHEEALQSSAHGAGRRMSRGEARAKISKHALERQMEGTFYNRRLLEKLRDEAPGAYKDIGAVMRAQSELTRIVRRLRPVVSYKGVG